LSLLVTDPDIWLGGHMWRIQEYGWGEFNVFPSISWLFHRWRGRGQSQTGWGSMAGFSPTLDPPLEMSSVKLG